MTYSAKDIPLFLNDESETGLSASSGTPILYKAQLPNHLIEAHHFDNPQSAQAFLDGFNHAGPGSQKSISRDTIGKNASCIVFIAHKDTPPNKAGIFWINRQSSPENKSVQKSIPQNIDPLLFHAINELGISRKDVVFNEEKTTIHYRGMYLEYCQKEKPTLSLQIAKIHNTSDPLTSDLQNHFKEHGYRQSNQTGWIEKHIPRCSSICNEIKKTKKIINKAISLAKKETYQTDFQKKCGIPIMTRTRQIIFKEALLRGGFTKTTGRQNNRTYAGSILVKNAEIEKYLQSEWIEPVKNGYKLTLKVKKILKREEQ